MSLKLGCATVIVFDDSPNFKFKTEIEEIQSLRASGKPAVESITDSKVEEKPAEPNEGNGKFTNDPDHILYRVMSEPHMKMYRHFMEEHTQDVLSAAGAASLYLNPQMDKPTFNRLFVATGIGLSYNALLHGDSH